MDYPLVSLDTPGCWRYSLDFVPKKPVAYVNLFNNQWSTNFRLWNRGTWTSRVRLWAIGITPPSRPSSPLTRSAQSVAGGRLRQRARRVAAHSARPGAFAQRHHVTAYGTNPDGPGTVLRLWEQAGQSGTVSVRLPEGIERQASPARGPAWPSRRQAHPGQQRQLQGPSRRIRPVSLCLAVPNDGYPTQASAGLKGLRLRPHDLQQA
jgi:hypothetical protein